MKYFSAQAQSGDRLYLTEIQAEVEGDAWFPEYEKKDWKEVSRDRRKDKASGLEYHFTVYDRVDAEYGV